MTWDVPESALKMARAVAKRVAKSHRQIIPEDELTSVNFEWIASNRKDVLDWSADPDMKNLLYTVMLRNCQQYVLNERTRSSGSVSDQYFYHLAVLETLLPDVWDVESWAAGSGSDEQEIRHKSIPSEGGSRMAMLADMAAALRTLSTDEERALQLRYRHGLTLQEIADKDNVSPEAVRKRVVKATVKIIDYVGGDSPWDLTRRVHRSNAKAQAETRNTYDGGKAWTG